MLQLLRGLVHASVAIFLAGVSPAMAQSATHSISASVRVDCSAFKKSSDRLWTVTKPTIVPAGSKGYVNGQIALPEGATVEPHLYHFHGIDLVDLLNDKCTKLKSLF